MMNSVQMSKFHATLETTFFLGNNLCTTLRACNTFQAHAKCDHFPQMCRTAQSKAPVAVVTVQNH